MFMQVSIPRNRGFIGLAIAFFIALAFTAGTSRITVYSDRLRWRNRFFPSGLWTTLPGARCFFDPFLPARFITAPDGIAMDMEHRSRRTRTTARSGEQKDWTSS